MKGNMNVKEREMLVYSLTQFVKEQVERFPEASEIDILFTISTMLNRMLQDLIDEKRDKIEKELKKSRK